MAFCIPKGIANKLKEAARSGEITIEKLFKTTSEERNKIFAKYSGDDLAREINAGFEKALSDKQKDSLVKWVEKVFRGKARESREYKDVIAKINDLDKLGYLTPENSESYLGDLVATRLGAYVKPEEAKIISEKAKVLQGFAKHIDDFQKFEDETTRNGIVDYFKARRDMENYLESLTPSSNLRIFTQTISRATMLFSLKSPVLNIESNTVAGIAEALTRRLANKQFGGANLELVKDYWKFVNRIYQESGYDISRMMALADGSKKIILGGEFQEVSTQGPGVFRAIARVYEDVVFKQAMGAPDVAFSAAHFGDSANLWSTKIAKQEGLSGDALKTRAKELFLDAVSVNPKTEEGILIRTHSIADARYGTYTNDSSISKVALGIRRLGNEAFGDLRVGDLSIPFAKTPANVINFGFDAAGLGLIKAVKKIAKDGAWEAAKNGDPRLLQEAMQGLVRSGIGLTAASLFAMIIDKEDYIGPFPRTEKERELFRTGNYVENSVRMGDKFIHLDYFGPLGAPLAGMLSAKKYGDDLPSYAYYYSLGVAMQLSRIPGIKEAVDAGKFVIEELTPETRKSFTDLADDAKSGAINFLRSRIIPGIVNDFARAMDDVERTTDPEKLFDRAKAGIPFLRETLPERKDILGEPVKTEPGLSIFLFGARVKSARDSALLNEFERLNAVGQLPSITDPERTNPRVKDFKTQTNEDEFRKAIDSFKNNFRERASELLEDSDYLEADDEEKKKLIEKTKNAILNEILDEFGYEKSKKE